MATRTIVPVCTNDEAREYFKNKGLSYNDIFDEDINVLCKYIEQECKKSNKSGETSVNTLRLSKKVDIKRDENGNLITCFLYLNSHYFTRRECISFNNDGFIGIAGWADDGNSNPIRRAFLRWCEYMTTRKAENDA